jgi:hypothetical protein
MNKEYLMKNIVERLVENVGRLRYGTVSVILKIHEANVVSVSHEITETTRKQEVLNADR